MQSVSSSEAKEMWEKHSIGHVSTFNTLFIYLWLLWVFVAGLSLVVTCGLLSVVASRCRARAQ